MISVVAMLAVFAVGMSTIAVWQFRRAERLADLYFNADVLRKSYLRRINELDRQVQIANGRVAAREDAA